jgi:hypothetical protein
MGLKAISDGKLAVVLLSGGQVQLFAFFFFKIFLLLISVKLLIAFCFFSFCFLVNSILLNLKSGCCLLLEAIHSYIRASFYLFITLSSMIMVYGMMCTFWDDVHAKTI